MKFILSISGPVSLGPWRLAFDAPTVEQAKIDVVSRLKHDPALYEVMYVDMYDAATQAHVARWSLQRTMTIKELVPRG